MNRRAASLILIAIFGAVSAAADSVVFIGNENVRSPTGELDDRIMQRLDLCKSISAAESLGQDVYLFIPSLTCGTKTYTGRCSENGCNPKQLKSLFAELSKKLDGREKRNLFIQTIGHGGNPNFFSSERRGPEFNDLQIQKIPPVGLTAVEFADILRSSGTLGKVNSVKSLVTQCYGGGWHELSRLIGPPGKFCALSQTRHDLPAVFVDREVTEGSVFTQGFWDSQLKTPGSSLSEAGLSAGVRMRESATSDSHITDWRTSSIYLTEKSTRTGPFQATDAEIRDRKSPPYAYFADGLDPLSENAVADALSNGTSAVSDETDAIRTRYKLHVYSVNSFNADKWFWQDPKKPYGAYLLKAASCPVVLNEKIAPGVEKLAAAMRSIRNELDRRDLGKNEDDVRKQIDAFAAALEKNRPAIATDVDRFWKRRNELLEESGAMMRKMASVGHLSDKYPELEKEYHELDRKFRDQDSLENFPTLREFVLMAKKVSGLRKLLALSDRAGGEDRDAIFASWVCENEPVFLKRNEK